MRKLPILIGALVAALAAGVLTASLGLTSSHREAPLTSQDPTGDDTDVYAFTAKDAPDKLTVVANWIPFEDAAGGPNFYGFDDRARYYVNIDNTGDGAFDVRYRFSFRTKVENKDTFLYAFPGVQSIDDPKLNIKQFYKLERLTYRNGKVTSIKNLGSDFKVGPNNVGPRTFPDYAKVANQAIAELPGGGKVFVGQREDAFFVDLGAAFDGINIRKGTGNAGGGKDDVAGYGTHSVVLQVPEMGVTRDAKPVAGADAKNAVVGVWASAERRKFQVTNKTVVGTPFSAKAKTPKAKASTLNLNPWVQVSRLGNPLINELVVPLRDKDKYNATQPQDDLKNFGKYALNSHLADVINQVFGTDIPSTNRTDIVNALLVGLPGLTKISPDAVPADTLKINLGTPPSEKENRFGVIGGDTGGFPNGRRLADDVVDIELRVIGGFLLGKKLPLGDGVDRNDVPFQSTFPYVSPLQSGFDSKLKRMEDEHAPTSADNPS
ncbi:MAG: DUF4331 domain-containing protein [Solirubrobacteraceae bacterium]|nr:DUF4331 domain-containing protein [Solirubrobacteraceae bacterium]